MEDVASHRRKVYRKESDFFDDQVVDSRGFYSLFDAYSEKIDA